MSNQPLCLREFMEPTPVCDQAGGMQAVVQLFRQGNCDRVVIVNRQQQPIGIVHLRDFAPYWGSHSWNDQPITLDQPGSVGVSPWVQPLPTLPADLPLDQSFPYVAGGSRFWALMDKDRKFEGLLDSGPIQKLYQYARAKNASLEPFSLASLVLEQEITPPTAFPQSTLRRHLGTGRRNEWTGKQGGAEADVNRLKAQLRVQIARLRSQLQAKQTLVDHIGQTPHGNLPLETIYSSAAEPLPPLDARSMHTAVDPAMTALMQFLERLPLPLMLQTDKGEVVAQNTVWLEQFGDLMDPGWVRRDAAALLEPQPIAPLQWQEVAAGWQQPISPDPSPSLCEIGGAPNTCICVCPLKNGQERMVQFIKVPLSGVLSGLEDDLAPGQPVPPQSLDRFRLATLEPTASDPWGTQAPPSLTSQVSSLWLVLAQDVTEQQQLAKELAAKNADLVQLNRLKDEFLACISHELRTPLTAVLGLSSLLKDQTLGALNERQVRYAQLIYRSGRHLMAIVNDILDLTRMETGQVELTPERLPIETICDRALEQAKQLRLMEAKPDMQQTEVEILPTPPFTLEIEPGLDHVVADEQRLLQMLVNLLSNALKFTETTGQVGLRITRWDGWIALTVWDTGIGIPADKQHLIFQKFQQLENPLTRRFEGAGLGLVLTQRLARLHGGDVTFVSKEHQGSEFTLLLPPIPDPDQASSEATPLSRLKAWKPKPPNRLVLIVEALVGVIEALTTQLSDLGYRVVIARSGTEALEKTRRLQPCAVFLNPLLPMLSGWDVLTLLKADDETRHIPVIMTGTGVDQDQAHRNHADGCLNVPIARPALQHILAQVTLPSLAEPSSIASGKGLVVLRLSPNRTPPDQAETQLNALLHQHNYRVLEVDDLEQADLLARVWQPRVTILSGTLSEPIPYLEHLASFPGLAALPLITLDHPTTQAANQVPGLLVFPCLVPLIEQIAPLPTEPSALLQVIEIAAGSKAKPDR
jgi:signal transduction histidine kinase/CheY-like chemotaxis protein